MEPASLREGMKWRVFWITRYSLVHYTRLERRGEL